MNVNITCLKYKECITRYKNKEKFRYNGFLSISVLFATVGALQRVTSDFFRVMVKVK